MRQEKTLSKKAQPDQNLWVQTQPENNRGTLVSSLCLFVRDLCNVLKQSLLCHFFEFVILEMTFAHQEHICDGIQVRCLGNAYTKWPVRDCFRSRVANVRFEIVARSFGDGDCPLHDAHHHKRHLSGPDKSITPKCV